MASRTGQYDVTPHDLRSAIYVCFITQGADHLPAVVPFAARHPGEQFVDTRWWTTTLALSGACCRATAGSSAGLAPFLRRSHAAQTCSTTLNLPA